MARGALIEGLATNKVIGDEFNETLVNAELKNKSMRRNADDKVASPPVVMFTAAVGT